MSYAPGPKPISLKSLKPVNDLIDETALGRER
jgi:hypothetical protein